MEPKVNEVLNEIRDWLVVLYELFGIVLILWVWLRCMSKGYVDIVVLGMLCYLLPYFAHVGCFGGRLKLVADRIMGYEH